MAEYHFQAAHDMLTTLAMEMGEHRLKIERDGTDLINRARHRLGESGQQTD